MNAGQKKCACARPCCVLHINVTKQNSPVPFYITMPEMTFVHLSYWKYGQLALGATTSELTVANACQHQCYHGGGRRHLQTEQSVIARGKTTSFSVLCPRQSKPSNHSLYGDPRPMGPSIAWCERPCACVCMHKVNKEILYKV